jgi:hypothetical protein
MEAEHRIVPRKRGYWIETVARDGSHRLIERYETEDQALQRLRALQHQVELAARRTTAQSPKAILPPLLVKLSK